jgi:hypothetical protein
MSRISRLPSIRQPSYTMKRAKSTNRLTVPRSPQLGLEHGELIRHDESDLVFSPVSISVRVLIGVGLGLSEDCEATLAQHVIGLPWCPTAPELLRQQNPAERIARGQTDDGVGWIMLTFVQKLVPR